MSYKNLIEISFVIANQWSFTERNSTKVQIFYCFKWTPSCAYGIEISIQRETDASEAYTQIRNYMHEIPSMFIYNCICVMSDQLTSKAGTITSGEDRFYGMENKRRKL